MSIVDKVQEYLGSVFGNEKSGAQAGGIAAVLGLGAVGFLTGDILGGVIGLGAGLVVGPIINGLVSGKQSNKWPTSGLSYAPPEVPQPEKDLVKKGVELKVVPELPAGFTAKPNLEKIKKLEFNVNKLAVQTDTAERIKNKEHKLNAFTDLDKKYTALFQFEVNFNEYVKLAKDYNTKDRPELVKQYEALQREKAKLEGKEYTGNPEQEAPKLPTPETDPLLRREALPAQFSGDTNFLLRLGKSLNSPEGIAMRDRYSMPYIMDTNKKKLAGNGFNEKVNQAIFDGGSKGETLFLANAAEHTQETDKDKLRAMWKEMPLVQKIQIVEKGLSKEFDAKTDSIDMELLGKTNGWHEFKKDAASWASDFSDGVISIFTFGQVEPPKSKLTFGSDSANSAASLKQMLEQSRPSSAQLKGIIDFAIANPASEEVKNEWIKLRDMLPLIEQRHLSRAAVNDFFRNDINPKQIYIAEKMQPYVAQTERFEQKVRALEEEVKLLRTKPAAKPVVVAPPVADFDPFEVKNPKERMREDLQDIKKSLEETESGRTKMAAAFKVLQTKLNATPPQSIDVTKDIDTLPVFDEKRREDELKKLRTAADIYNAALATYTADNNKENERNYIQKHNTLVAMIVDHHDMYFRITDLVLKDIKNDTESLHSRPIEVIQNSPYMYGKSNANSSPSNEQKDAKIVGKDMMQIHDPKLRYDGDITAIGNFDEAKKIFTVTGFELRPKYSEPTKGGYYFAYNGEINLADGKGFEELFKAITPKAETAEFMTPRLSMGVVAKPEVAVASVEGASPDLLEHALKSVTFKPFAQAASEFLPQGFMKQLTGGTLAAA